MRDPEGSLSFCKLPCTCRRSASDHRRRVHLGRTPRFSDLPRAAPSLCVAFKNELWGPSSPVDSDPPSEESAEISARWVSGGAEGGRHPPVNSELQVPGIIGRVLSQRPASSASSPSCSDASQSSVPP